MTKEEYIKSLAVKLVELDKQVDRLYESFRTETTKYFYQDSSEAQCDRSAAAAAEYRHAKQHRDEVRSLYTSLKESLQ